MENKQPKISEGAMAWVRLALFLLPAVNAMLVMAGIEPLPFDEYQLENTLIMAIGLVAGVISWWKNNNVTKKAQLKKAATDNKTEDELKELAGK